MDWYEITIVILLVIAAAALVVARIMKEVRSSKSWPEILAAIPEIITEAVQIFSDYPSQLQYVIVAIENLAAELGVKVDEDKISEAVNNMMGASNAISTMSLAQEAEDAPGE